MNTKETWLECHRRHQSAIDNSQTQLQRKTYLPLREATHDALREFNQQQDHELIKSASWKSKFQRLFGKSERGG